MHKGSLKCFFKWLKWHHFRFRDGFLWLVGCLFLFGVKIQHITLTAKFSCRTAEKNGWTHRLSDSNVRGKQEECFDSFMHRLWLFSCSHSPTWPLRKKKRRKKQTENKYMLIINLDKMLKVFPVSISEDLMHNVIGTDLETHSKYLKPFLLGTSFPLNKKDVWGAIEQSLGARHPGHRFTSSQLKYTLIIVWLVSCNCLQNDIPHIALSI